MRLLILATLLCTGFAFAADADPASAANNKKNASELVTVEGCVSRSSGDYILFRQDPAETYELEASRGIKLSRYLGQWVVVTGRQFPSLSTSSDALTRMGSASPVTIAAKSIQTVAQRCSIP